MSDARQIVTLSIGSNRLNMGVFSRSGKKLILNKYASRNLVIDPTGGVQRVDQLGSTVAELMAELGVKGKDLNYSVSGQEVFIRFIKLPPIANTDVDQLVKFEAQQQIPVPIEEIIWDYHLLPSSGIEQEALLVAIKADVLNAMNDELMALRFGVGKVGVGVATLFNSYRDSYPEEVEPVMIVDIGAKTTDIIYSEAGRFFTRSVSVAGVFVTSAIARDLGIGFAEAEGLKIAKGMVSMTNGQMEGVDADVAALATSIRNAMTRLASEIQRTTNHYRMQMQGNAPVKVYLCGGGALLPYAKEFLEERLSLPVSFFNPLHNVGVGSQVNSDLLTREALMLGGMVGMALSVIGRTSIDIDLEPTVIGKIRDAKKRFPKVVTGVLIALIGAGAFAYIEKEAVSTAEKKLADLSSVERKAKNLQAQITQDESTIGELDGQYQAYAHLALQKTGYIDIIKRFVELAASDAFWVVDFDPIMAYDTENFSPIATGVSTIKDTFITDKATSLVTTMPQSNTEEDQRPRRGGAADDAPSIPVVNAIRLKGLSRVDKEGDKIVQEIKNRIAQMGEESLFTFKKADGSELGVRDVLTFEELGGRKRAGGSAEGVSFSTPFTLILPLKTPIPVLSPSSNN